MPAHHHRGLVVIGCFKLVKAVGLAVVGLGLLSLVHRDVAATIEALVEQLRIDPENRVIHALVEKSLGVRLRTLEAMGVGTLFYAMLFATEGGVGKRSSRGVGDATHGAHDLGDAEPLPQGR